MTFTLNAYSVFAWRSVEGLIVRCVILCVFRDPVLWRPVWLFCYMDTCQVRHDHRQSVMCHHHSRDIRTIVTITGRWDMTTVNYMLPWAAETWPQTIVTITAETSVTHVTSHSSHRYLGITAETISQLSCYHHRWEWPQSIVMLLGHSENDHSQLSCYLGRWDIQSIVMLPWAAETWPDNCHVTWQVRMSPQSIDMLPSQVRHQDNCHVTWDRWHMSPVNYHVTWAGENDHSELSCYFTGENDHSQLSCHLAGEKTTVICVMLPGQVEVTSQLSKTHLGRWEWPQSIVMLLAGENGPQSHWSCYLGRF